MDSNFLDLNENKIQIVILGEPDLLNDPDGPCDSLISCSQSFVKVLGVIFGSSFKFNRKIVFKVFSGVVPCYLAELLLLQIPLQILLSGKAYLFI